MLNQIIIFDKKKTYLNRDNVKNYIHWYTLNIGVKKNLYFGVVSENKKGNQGAIMAQLL